MKTISSPYNESFEYDMYSVNFSHWKKKTEKKQAFLFCDSKTSERDKDFLREEFTK